MEALAKADRLIAEGHDFEDKGDFDAALDSYRAAVAAAADYPRAHMNVGNALRKLERLGEALAAQRQAVSCAPDFAQARFNLGSLLAACDEPAMAEQELREALRLQPDMAEAALVLADLFESGGRLAEAESELQRAIRIRPDYTIATLNLGLFYIGQDRFEDALEWLQRARGLDPSLKDVESFLLFCLNLRTDLDASEIAREHELVGAAISRSAGSPFTHWLNQPDPDRRLRLGYVSGDFRHHPVALFIRPVLEQHDRNQFDIYCYSNYTDANPIAQTMRQHVRHWREISDVDDRRASDLLRADEIDILVDLSGHTNRNRLPVFARHPAPVQVTWLGYLNTTGLAAMDYRICDWHTDPEGATANLHTEKLYRMPYSQWCYRPWYEVSPVAHPHAHHPEAIVFGSFNQYYKMSDPCLDLWCRILGCVPEARLVVLGVREAALHKQLLDRMERRAIHPSRIEIRGRESVAEYFNAIGNVDIALDTMPYNGATTTFDTLWMGVPLVALRGERGISRGSYSILQSLGMPGLTVGSPEEYVEANVALAHDPPRRHELRASLRGHLATSPLMDARGFVADLEAGYHQMWRDWCEKQRTRSPRG